MQIRKIHIENFGKLHAFDMELKNGLNMVCAYNGWGKTTLAAFLKAMFYGLDYTTKRSLKENERKKYAPWQGGAFGGSMEFTTDEKTYRVERFFGVKDKEDTFHLWNLETGLESGDYSERLGEELFHLDKTAFERSSFFAQQDFAAALNDSLNARLTRVEEDAGDMQNYEKALASLEERMKYYQKTGNRGQLGQWEQERRQVSEELSKCRTKEDAVAEWKGKIILKEQRAAELCILTGRAEEQLKMAQEYEAKAERKARYELLRQQAGRAEEQLRRTGGELARFTGAPLQEEVLDRCHEGIYRLNSLRIQERGIKDKVYRAEQELEKVNHEEEALPAKSGKALWVATVGLTLFISVVFAAALQWYLPGFAILLAGCGMVWYLVQREKRAKGQRALWEEELTRKERELSEVRSEYENLCRGRSGLEEQLRQTLHIPASVSSEEMEYYWKLERQKSQEYVILKQNYSTQEKESRRSREMFREYAGKFSREELLEFEMLEKPAKELSELQEELQRYRREQESLVQEQSQLENRVRFLNEEAERIPELEEESERLEQKIEAGAREHDLLEKTIRYLKAAREQFSTRYLKELQQGLEKYLTELEPEQDSIPALDVKLKVKMQEAGASRDLEYFSAGWQDMVQIAERFAIVEALYEEEQPVLILDDPFVNLDTKKQRRAMDMLERLAGKWQMVYFTCHE